MRRLLTIILILFALSVRSAYADHIPARVLVTLETSDNRAAEAVVKAVKASGKGVPGFWRRIGRGRSLVVETTPGQERNALKRFLNRREVVAAELDELCAPIQETAPLVPSDTYYPNQWHLPNIGANLAWTLATGSVVKIAICDTGCDPTHPDLKDRYTNGWNFYDNNSTFADVHGHGTHVAGIAGATGNNALGVSGVGWSFQIVPYRVTDSTGYASFSRVSEALHQAADIGCKVANVSFGNAATSSTILTAGQYFYEHGGLLCIAAGNTGGAIVGGENRFVLVVGATDSNNAKASFSSTGDFVSLCAPGVNVWSTKRGGTYGGGSGTSFSSPVVAGCAALLWAKYPGLTPQQVRALMVQTATDLGSAGKDASYGWGKVNVYKALQAAATPPPAVDDILPTGFFIAPRSGSRVKSRDLKVEVSASDNVGVASVQLTMDGMSYGSATYPPYRWIIPNASITPGSHVLTAVIADAAGNKRTISVSIVR